MTPNTALLVTTSYDDAATLVETQVKKAGMETFRLNTDRFPTEVKINFNPLGEITFSCDQQTITDSQIYSVWYRRHATPTWPENIEPGHREFCERECRAFLSGVLSSLTTERWLSAPTAIHKAEQKPYQLAIAKQVGFQIPETFITNDPTKVWAFAENRYLIAKAVRSGYIATPEGNQAIFTSEVGPQDLQNLDGLSLSPVIFQEKIRKQSDIRITVIGSESFAAEILSQENPSSETDWRATDDPELKHRIHRLPDKIESYCQEIVARLGIQYGAIDLALTPEGNYVFFEVNPNGQWLWLERQLDFPIAERIARWLTN